MKTGVMQVIKDQMPAAVTVKSGVIKSVAPLSVQVVGDEKLLLTAELLIVPQHLTRHDVIMDIPKMCNYSGEGACNYNGEGAVVTVHSELKMGDTVCLLSFNSGKKYYILDRSM